MKSSTAHPFLMLLLLTNFATQASQEAPRFDYERLALPPDLPALGLLERPKDRFSSLENRDIKNLPIVALHRARGNLAEPQLFSHLQPILTQCQRYADIAIDYVWQGFHTNLDRRETQLVQNARSLLCPLLKSLWKKGLKQRYNSQMSATRKRNLYQKTALYQMLARETFHAEEWQVAAVPDSRTLTQVLVSKWDPWPHLCKPTNREFYNWAHGEIQRRDLTRTTEIKELIIENGRRLADRSFYAHSYILDQLRRHVVGVKSSMFYSEPSPNELQEIFKVLVIHGPNTSRPLALIYEKIIVDVVLAHIEDEESDDVGKIERYKKEQKRLLTEINTMIQTLLPSKPTHPKQAKPKASEKAVLISESGDQTEPEPDDDEQAEDERKHPDI